MQNTLEMIGLICFIKNYSQVNKKSSYSNVVKCIVGNYTAYLILFLIIQDIFKGFCNGGTIMKEEQKPNPYQTWWEFIVPAGKMCSYFGICFLAFTGLNAGCNRIFDAANISVSFIFFFKFINLLDIFNIKLIPYLTL